LQFRETLQTFGANILPIKGETKIPLGGWRQWLSEPQSSAYLDDDRWGYAAKTGIVNGWNQWRSVDFDGCPLEVVHDYLAAIGLDRDYPWLETSQSGNGYHVWILCPDDALFGLSESEKGVYVGRSRDGAFKQIEIRWRDSQTVVAGRWLNGAPSVPPAIVESADIVQAFRRLTRPGTEGTKGEAGEEWSIIPEGMRDPTLTSFAGSMRQKGMAREAMRPVLHDLNERLCVPPLPESQVDKITDSIGGKPAGKLAHVQDAGSDWKLLSASELKALPKPDFLIDGIYPELGLGVMYGEPETYKSFQALNIAYCVATGLPYMGNATKQGAAAYIAAEGSEYLGDRLEGLERIHGLPTEKLWFLPEAAQLGNSGHVDRVIQLLEAIGEPVRLVVIDTLSETAIGLKENQQEDMSLYLGAAKRFKAELGAAVLILHHKNKGQKEIRGSTVILGTVDTAIEVCRQEGTDRRVTLQAAKQRGFDRFAPIYLQGNYVDLGEDRRPTLVFTPDESPNPGVSVIGSRVTPKQAEVLAALAAGQTLTFGQWREASKVADRTFADAVSKLVSRGLVRHADHGYSLATAEGGTV